VTHKYLQIRVEDGRVMAVCQFPEGMLLPQMEGWIFHPAPPHVDAADWREWRLMDGQIVLHSRDENLPAWRALAEQRIDGAALRAMESMRPAAAARMDADRVRQAELALASAEQYGHAYPLLGGTGPLHERARAVLAAAQATADRLAAIDVARRAAKARIRAATTKAEIEAVTLENLA
jgi:hypothetical protein